MRSEKYSDTLEAAIAHFGSYDKVFVALSLSVATDIAQSVGAFCLSGLAQGYSSPLQHRTILPVTSVLVTCLLVRLRREVSCLTRSLIVPMVRVRQCLHNCELHPLLTALLANLRPPVSRYVLSPARASLRRPVFRWSRDMSGLRDSTGAVLGNDMSRDPNCASCRTGPCGIRRGNGGSSYSLFATYRSIADRTSSPLQCV